jgi:hypothetical protein
MKAGHCLGLMLACMHLAALPVLAGHIYVTTGLGHNVEPYYEALAPHGTWFRTESLGWVWQPHETAGSAEWRPYLHGGRWLLTQDGWYWHSEYAWGWAPFHYGRWVCTDRYRWVWIPGTVWAPAWVHWRHTPRYYGWAPLPPDGFNLHLSLDLGSNGGNLHLETSFLESDYAFLPRDRFLTTTQIASSCIPRHHHRAVYQDSIVGCPPRNSIVHPAPHHTGTITYPRRALSAPSRASSRAQRVHDSVRRPSTATAYKPTIPHVSASRRLSQESARNALRSRSNRLTENISSAGTTARRQTYADRPPTGRAQRLHTIVRSRFGR